VNAKRSATPGDDRHGSGLGVYHAVAATYHCGCGNDHESHTAPFQANGVLWSPECVEGELREQWKKETFHVHYGRRDIA
jgi:hypothetical protein